MKPTTQTPSKKSLLKLGLPATLVAGIAVGALFSPIGIASAAEDPSTDEQTSSEDGTREKPTDAEREARKAQRQEQREARKAAVAEILGISVEDLEAAKEDGKTLAEIADENGVERADLVASLVAAAEERVDQAVADGKFDEEKAAEIKENLEERVENRIDNVRGEKGEDGNRKRGHGKRHGSSDKETAPAEADSADTDTTES